MSLLRGWLTAFVGVILVIPWAAAAPPTDRPHLSPEKAKGLVQAAHEFAEKIAGDDEPRYLELFNLALRAAGRPDVVPVQPYPTPRIGRTPVLRRGDEILTAGGARTTRRGPTSDRGTRQVQPFADRFEEKVRALGRDPRVASPPPPRTDLRGLRNQVRLIRECVSSPARRTPYVFGGTAAEQGEFPHCVALGIDNRFSCCTGTLVGPNVVVTAAHCPELGCKPTQVYFGIDARDGQVDPEKVYEVKEVLPHREFNEQTFENDIAVLILKERVRLPGVKPCRLATTADVNEAFFLRVAGFGLTESGEAGRLFAADLGIHSHSCQEEEVQRAFACNANKEIVAGGPAQNTCKGDSGGPAYVLEGNELLLAGVTSGGDPNCTRYGVYTRVDVYEDWIRSTAKEKGGEIGNGKTPDAPAKPKDSAR